MKKAIGLFVSLYLFTNVGLSQNEIVAGINNLKNNNGVCRACIFNNPSSFTSETAIPFKCITVPIKNQSATALFNDIPPGTYAMFVLHDENNNNKMDKNFIGIPKEGYGASGNKLPFASAPGYNDNKFIIEGNTTVKLFIKVRNLY